jgi:predicted alpha/beta-fold hydrolase
MTSPRCYSASFTDDVHQAVGALHARFPAAPLLAAGYSLGALILTKYLAEVDQGHWPSSEGARPAACRACRILHAGGAPPQLCGR